MRYVRFGKSLTFHILTVNGNMLVETQCGLIRHNPKHSYQATLPSAPVKCCLRCLNRKSLVPKNRSAVNKNRIAK